MPEALRGLTEPFIPVRLPELVGLAKARWMIYTGEEIDAAEAERIGLVGKVVAHAQLDDALEQTLDALKRTGPGARRHYKRMINAALPPVVFDEFLASMRSDEPREGMRSFAEKRPPSWAQPKESSDELRRGK